MPKNVPKWIEKRYAILWREKGDKKFDFKDAVEVTKDKKPIASIVLSELRRAGWLKVEINEKDTRKKFYTLVPIDNYIKMKVKDLEILNM